MPIRFGAVAKFAKEKMLQNVTRCVYSHTQTTKKMKTIPTKRIHPTIPVALEPEIKAYIKRRITEYQAAQLRKEAGHA